MEWEIKRTAVSFLKANKVQNQGICDFPITGCFTSVKSVAAIALPYLEKRGHYLAFRLIHFFKLLFSNYKHTLLINAHLTR